MRLAARPTEKRPGSLPAFTLLGLAAVPGPPRHFELEPRLPGLDRFGAVLDARAALFGGASHQLNRPCGLNAMALNILTA